MKKVFIAIITAATTAFFSGCTPTQQQLAAQQLGIAAAVTWVKVDKPTPADIQTAIEITEQVKAICTNGVAPTTSFYATVYPRVDKYISDNVLPENQPMARLASGWLLTELDMVFALNPDWTTDQQDKLDIANAFCDGFIGGLKLTPRSPVVQAAMAHNIIRVKCQVLLSQ